MHEPKLSGMDAACLAIETAAAPLHTVAVLTLDAASDDGTDASDALIHAIHRLVEQQPRLRAQLVESPLGLVPPSLEPTDLPNLDQHLARVRVPRPGGPRELGRLVDDILTRPLPRGCPLWEAHLVEGLASGAAVLVVKLHCVPLDGTTAWHLAQVLADEASAEGVGPAIFEPSVAATSPAPSTEGVGRIVAGPARWLRATSGLLGAALREIGGGDLDGPPRPDPPSGSRLNAPTLGGRRAGHATLRAETVDRVAKVFAVAPETIVLATIAGALSAELTAAGEMQTRPLVAAVLRERTTAGRPVPTRPRISLERLPTHVALPGARIRMVHREETLGPLLIPETLTGHFDAWADATSPFLFDLAARVARDLELGSRLDPIANLIVTLALSAATPPRIDGVRVEHLHPHGPLPEGINLHVAAQRIGGAIDVGITSAGDALPDPWRYAAGLGDALRELHAAALALESQ